MPIKNWILNLEPWIVTVLIRTVLIFLHLVNIDCALMLVESNTVVTAVIALNAIVIYFYTNGSSVPLHFCNIHCCRFICGVLGVQYCTISYSITINFYVIVAFAADITIKESLMYVGKWNLCGIIIEVNKNRVFYPTIIIFRHSVLRSAFPCTVLHIGIWLI